MRVRDIPGIDPLVAQSLSRLWIETAGELVSVLSIPKSRDHLGQFLGLDQTGLGQLQQLVTASMGKLFVQSAFSPRAVPALGIPLRPPPTSVKGGPALLCPDRFPDMKSRLQTASFHIPEYFSIQEKMQPIRDQGGRGTCVSFATTAAREFLLPQPDDLSEQFLYWGCKEMDGCPDEEGTWPSVAAQVIGDVGICQETDWEYNPYPIEDNEGQGPPPSCALENAWVHHIGGFLDLQGTSAPLPPMIQTVLLGFDSEGRHLVSRPVVIGIPVYESWRSAETYRTGKIYRRIGNEPPIGGHAMCVVGYRLDPSVPGGGYFIVRNSWGEDWAPACPEGKGHALISFQYIEESLPVLLCGTALFSSEELAAVSADGDGDDYTRRAFDDGWKRFIEHVPGRVTRIEAVQERAEERSFRPDGVLESERVVQRTIHRFVLNGLDLDMNEASAARDALRGPAIATAVSRKLDDMLFRLSQDRLDLDGLLAESRKLIPREDWIEGFVFSSGGSRRRDPAEFPFRRLPVRRMALPPIRGLVSVLSRKAGVHYALPGSRFRIVLPQSKSESKPIAVCEWLNVPPEAKERLGADTEVFLVDTGLDLRHPAFAALPTGNCRDFTGGSGMRDPDGHGTHCAGILAGNGAAGERFGGVAPKVNLHMGRVFDDDGYATLEGLYQALDWAVDAGAHVISLSLGTGESPDGNSQISQVCGYLAEEADILVCVSAGNSGPEEGSITPPADARNVVSVAALDSERRLAHFSSRGTRQATSPIYRKPDVAGPGVFVVSSRSGDCSLEPYGDYRHYTLLSGTSMSCPAIAGVCALLWSACPESDRKKKRQRVLDVLYENCVLPGTPGEYSEEFEVGHGVPDVGRALEAVASRQGEAGFPFDANRAADSARGGPVGMTTHIRKCSWTGVAFGRGFLEGQDYFPCGNPSCKSGPDDRWISANAWNDYHQDAGESRWCANCLRRRHEEATPAMPLGAADAHQRFQSNVTRFFGDTSELTLEGRSWCLNSGPIQSRSMPSTRLFFLPEPAEKPTVQYFTCGLVNQRFLKSECRTLVLAFVRGETFRSFQDMLSRLQFRQVQNHYEAAVVGWNECLFDLLNADYVYWGAVGLPGDSICRNRLGRSEWCGVPAIRHPEQWAEALPLPASALGENLPRWFSLETEKERQDRAFLFLQELFQEQFSRTGNRDVVVTPVIAPRILNFPDPGVWREIGNRFCPAGLTVECEDDGRVKRLTLRDAIYYFQGP